ncbi:MAG TPA: hypothetical protein PKJ77_06930, partial [Thermodesulfobacteriota bacterium]|nr:hypothetical protein [Thermodesulfobacteriota bacterium]
GKLGTCSLSEAEDAIENVTTVAALKNLLNGQVSPGAGIRVPPEAGRLRNLCRSEIFPLRSK